VKGNICIAPEIIFAGQLCGDIGVKARQIALALAFGWGC
jgi:hypothetical protein